MKNLTNKLKRMVCAALALALIGAPMVDAQEEAAVYEASDWARASIDTAIALGFLEQPYGGDFREPAGRADFAAQAASMVALAHGATMEGYCLIMNYRGLADNGAWPNLTAEKIAQDLGIIKGRENGDWDEYSNITRQEAAVMLARTYRAYHAKTPELVQPLTFVDQAEIAPWAREDVQLMNQLGIMTGTTGNRFDPYGTYTMEQGLVTLLRLYEKAPYDESMEKNPFEIPKRAPGLLSGWKPNFWLFAVETGEYYVLASIGGTGAIGVHPCYIDVVDQKLSLKRYDTAILTHATNRGQSHALPVYQGVSDDGTKLIYTAVVEEDAYRYLNDWETNTETKTLLFLKGVYTVTMDLKTGEQTYTRADLPKEAAAS